LKTELTLRYASGFYEAFKRAPISVQNENGEEFTTSLKNIDTDRFAQAHMKSVKHIVHACTNKRVSMDIRVPSTRSES